MIKENGNGVTEHEKEKNYAVAWAKKHLKRFYEWIDGVINSINTAIDEREKEDEKLQGNIDKEAAARQAADNGLSTRINQEATTRTGEVQELSQRLYKEVSDRKSADDTLQPAAVDAAREAARKVAKDALADYSNTIISGNAIITDIVIPASGWTAYGDAVDGYGYAVDVDVPTATAEMVPNVALHKSSLSIAVVAGVCPTAKTLDGAVRLWAKEIPTGDMTATLAMYKQKGET